MLNASQINNLIPDNGSLVLCFSRTKDGTQLTVVVDPRRNSKSDGKKESEALQEALSPKTVTGSPEMLDQHFMEYLTKTITAANTLMEQIENIDKETLSTIDKIKTEASKKIAEASKNKAKSGSTPSKQVNKSPASPSATKAVLGDEGEEEGEDGGTETTAETKKEEPKPEVKEPALNLF
ncbi:MAG: PRTRC system protein E [Nitrospiria bacterium]